MKIPMLVWTMLFITVIMTIITFFMWFGIMKFLSTRKGRSFLGAYPYRWAYRMMDNGWIQAIFNFIVSNILLRFTGSGFYAGMGNLAASVLFPFLIMGLRSSRIIKV